MTRARRTDSPRKPRRRVTPRWLTTKQDLDAVAKNRVLMVLSVLSGEAPVTTAIEGAGISRGFYYQLETKALNAMLLALAPGGEGAASPDATGLHHRIKELEAKVARAEQDKRRAERLLLLQRKVMGSGPIKTGRGRPAKTTSSTTGGRSGWRSSTRRTRTTASSAAKETATAAKPRETATAAKPTTTSPPTPTGGNAAP